MSDKKNLLIVGNSIVATAFAEKLLKNENIGKIYVAPGGIIESDNIESVDIREDDITGLLKFAIENDIAMTIPVSETALKADIVSFFLDNGQNIFGPVKDACNIAFNNVLGKKFLYKIHAQTSKFGIFDKIQMAEDWLRGANFPVTIKTSQYSGRDDRLVCPTMRLAREFLDTLFVRGESGVLVEEYTYGHNFTVYYITDGYSAVPLTVVANYKFAQDGDGGFFTDGMGCYVNDYKVSDVILERVGNVVRNTLVSLEKKGSPYVGILGVDCTMTGEDKFFVNEFKSFLQNCDVDAVLNLVEDDLIKIFFACTEGLFADEYEEIKLNNLSSVSAVVLSRVAGQVINGLESLDDTVKINYFGSVKRTNDDKYITGIGEAFVLSCSASTLTRAKQYIYENLEAISFSGMRYRRDICNL